MVYEDKFSLTVEENIFVAKRNIVDYIYKSARLEGLGVTFPDTETIVNGGIVQGLKVDEVVAINNLKHAWYFLFENIDYPTEYPLICEINRKVGENLFFRPGYLRSIPVRIGGTSWQPQIPIEVDIRDEIRDIMGISNATERAITLMLSLMRRQMFLDGNKRTAILAANHIMISTGAGIISVPVNHIKTFSTKLMEYYETNDMNDVLAFVFIECIDGMHLEKERDRSVTTGISSNSSFEDWKSQINKDRSQNNDMKKV
jgi:hypothetical protein